jgi:hypothetical protein
VSLFEHEVMIELLLTAGKADVNSKVRHDGTQPCLSTMNLHGEPFHQRDSQFRIAMSLTYLTNSDTEGAFSVSQNSFNHF